MAIQLVSLVVTLAQEKAFQKNFFRVQMVVRGRTIDEEKSTFFSSPFPRVQSLPTILNAALY